jgi:hypothetical protein
VSTHRLPYERDPAQSEGVDHVGDIVDVGLLRDIIGTSRTTAVAALVEGDHAVLGLQAPYDSGPLVGAPAQTMEQENGRTIATGISD